jgi:hypothetical protein
MSTTLITVLGSGFTALFLLFLFRIERARGKRFGEGIRKGIDKGIESMQGLFRRILPEVNSVFFQEFAHYVTHMLLSKALGFLRLLESVTLSVVRFNRTQALKLRRRGMTTDTEQPLAQLTASSEHFQAIQEHKKTMELTDAQKEKRKNAALLGNKKF